MTEPKEIKHLELKRKSKKIKKSYNLLDFVVVKQKNKKTQEIRKVKVSKAIQKRGKIRKRKVTTIKKRIVRERIAKQSILGLQAESFQDISLNEATEIVTESLAEGSIEEDVASSLCQAMENVTVTSVQHSRNFRDYCNHFITQEIKHLTEQVLKDLFKFQENKFQLNPGNNSFIAHLYHLMNLNFSQSKSE